MSTFELVAGFCLLVAVVLASVLIWDTCVRETRDQVPVRVGLPSTYRRQKETPLVERLTSHLICAWVVAAIVTALLLDAQAWTF